MFCGDSILPKDLSWVFLYSVVQFHFTINLDKKKVGHKLIRRVSLDKFYALVTGQGDAFYQMCMILPTIIKKAVKDFEGTIVPHDTVIDELKEMAAKQDIESEDMAFAMAVYMLGFGNYIGSISDNLKREV